MTLPDTLAAPGLITKTLSQEEPAGKGAWCPEQLRTTKETPWIASSKHVPASPLISSRVSTEKGTLKTTEFITSKEQVLPLCFEFVMQLIAEAGA